MITETVHPYDRANEWTRVAIVKTGKFLFTGCVWLLIVVGGLLFTGATALVVADGAFQTRPVKPATGSMQPWANLDDYIWLHPSIGGDMTVGRIVAVAPDLSKPEVVYIHRVTGIVNGEAVTQGDDSDVADPFRTTQANVVAVPGAVTKGIWARGIDLIADFTLAVTVLALLIITLLTQRIVNGLLDRRDMRRYKRKLAAQEAASPTSGPDSQDRSTSPEGDNA